MAINFPIPSFVGQNFVEPVTKNTYTWDGSKWTTIGVGMNYISNNGGYLTGQLLISDGTSINPAIAFNSYVNTGTYLVGAGGIGFSILGQNAFTIGSNRNIGIGNTSPQDNLDVRSLSSTTVRIQSNAGNRIRLVADTNGFNDFYFESSTGDASIARFYTGSTEAFRIDSSSQIGIGGTPSFKLDVISSSGVNTVRSYSVNSTDARFVAKNISNETLFGSDSIGSYVSQISNLPFRIITNNTESLRVLGDGSVGVKSDGTTNARFHVSGVKNSNIVHFESGTGTYDGILLQSDLLVGQSGGVKWIPNTTPPTGTTEFTTNFANNTFGGTVRHNVAVGGNLSVGADVITNSIKGNTSLTIQSSQPNSNINLIPNGTGSVNLSDKKITNLASPTNPKDAANKLYVDSQISIAVTTPELLEITGQGYLKKGSDGVWVLDRKVGFLNNIYYVSKDGSDSNDGTSIETSKLTIKAALELTDKTALFHKAQDASNILESNRQFLIEETFGWLSDTNNVPAFVNPNPEKCKRDLGYIIDAFIQDLRQTGNISSIEAGEAYYNGNTLLYIQNEKQQTILAIQKLSELCILAIRNFDLNQSGTKYQKQYATVNYTILSNIIQEPFPQCSDIASVLAIYANVVIVIINDGPGSVQRIEPTTGSTVYVKNGNYREDNPLYVPAEVSLIGDNLRDVTVIPINQTQDIFWVNNGSYITQMSFRGHKFPAAAVAFPNSGAGTIYKSPYVQNCTSFGTTGAGMRVDGSKAAGLKSMVLDSYTQYNQGGIGIEILNEGYAQLVSIFTICCDKAVYVKSGGTCSITNSNTDFGNYGLVADGVGPLQFTSAIDGNQTNTTILSLKNITKRPYLGQVMTVGGLFYFVQEIKVTNQGSGYSSTTPPSVTIDSPTGVSGIPAKASAVVVGGKVTSIILISEGRQYTGVPTVTIDPPPIQGGIQATAEATIYPRYYTVLESTDIDENGKCIVTLEENLPYLPQDNDVVNFYQVSSIIASSHCFEYVGSGTDIDSARPSKGGVTKTENEVVRLNGGRVSVTSTDQSGNFKIGSDLVLNQNTGTLTGRTFTKSLFATMTPLILALEG